MRAIIKKNGFEFHVNSTDIMSELNSLFQENPQHEVFKDTLEDIENQKKEHGADTTVITQFFGFEVEHIEDEK